MDVPFLNSKRDKVVKRLIDFVFLKKSYKDGLLKNANVFAKLLGICDDDKFKKIEFKNNNDLFLEFDITSNQWDNIILFLKFGEIHDDYLEELINTSTILGGIPSLDKYYKERTDSKKKFEKELENYNPLKPEDDIKKKYQWTTIRVEYHSNEKKMKLSEQGHSYCSKETIMAHHGEITDLIYRKLIN